MLWTALHLTRLALEVAAQRAGSDQAAPLVLVRDNRVEQHNAAAARLGVQHGSTLATAVSLAAEGEALQHLQDAPEQTRARLTLIADLLYRFSSEVSLDGEDAIVLEVGRSLRLFGSHKALDAEIERLCETLGHAARVRTAPTPSAALTLARAGCRQLHEVPLACMALDARTVERCSNMGLRSLGQLLALPDRELGQRFGPRLVQTLQRLDGRAPDPRKAIVPRERFRESLHLLEPLRSKDALEAPMQQLLAMLGHWLTSRQLGAGALVWRFLTHNAQDTVRLPVRLSRPQQQARAFHDITRLQLAQATLPEDVLGVGLDAHRLEPWNERTPTLFRHGLEDAHAQPHATPAALAELLDQLGARFGAEACLHLSSLDQHLPEQAWQLQPAGQPQACAAAAANRHRPIWLFAPPKRVTAAELALLDGPERIQSGWWAEAVSRDYYVAKHVSGARCWAFRDASAQWYLHGYFG